MKLSLIQTAIAELGETAHLTFRDPEGNILVDGKCSKKYTTVSQ